MSFIRRSRFALRRGALFFTIAALLGGCTGERHSRQSNRGSGGGGDSAPGDSAPGDSAPGDSTPGDSIPGDGNPGDGLIGLGELEVTSPSAFYDGTILTVDIGTVPLFGRGDAIFTLRNIGSGPLSLEGAAHLPGSVVGSTWLPPTINGGVPAVLLPGDTTVMAVSFEAVSEGPAQVDVAIRTDVGAPVTVRARATAMFAMQPDFEVEYNGIIGPTPSECFDIDGDGAIDRCTMGEPFSFGTVGLGSSVSARLVLRNSSRCPAGSGVDRCSACPVTIGPDPTLPGLTIENDPGGLFSFAGSVVTPFSLAQADGSCSPPQTGEARVLLQFTAPSDFGFFTATVVVQTDLPNKPLIEIPVTAEVVDTPIAVADFLLCGPDAPPAACTDPSAIDAGTRVYLDGRAKGTVDSSHDPSNPADPSRINLYRWRVVNMPTGLNAADLDPNPASLEDTIGLFDFLVPMPGHYTVQLEVRNASGSWSDPRSLSGRVEIDVRSAAQLLVQLVWDSPTSDQDIHLLNVPMGGNACNIPWDCHWRNRTPVWFDAWPAGSGPNPSLDLDDTVGFGPELLRIDRPQPGTYRIVVHDFYDNASTRNTVRIYLNGILAGEYSRSLNHKDAWAVATVTWYPDGTALVAPYPSGSPGEIGAVANIPTCDGSFPFP